METKRIMKTVEKTATGVTPAELILNNSLRLTKSIFIEPSTMDRSRLKSPDSWISRQAILVNEPNSKQIQYKPQAVPQFFSISDPCLPVHYLHSFNKAGNDYLPYNVQRFTVQRYKSS